jgi:hypothetical protein
MWITKILVNPQNARCVLHCVFIAVAVYVLNQLVQAEMLCISFGAGTWRVLG